MICGKCKTINEPDNRFCSECGADLEKQAEEAKQVGANRPGCLGCLGLFAIFLIVIGIGGFFYLNGEDVIYKHASGRWEAVYITVYTPVLYESADKSVTPGLDPRATILHQTGDSIRLGIKYFALKTQDPISFEVRTSRLIQDADGLIRDRAFKPVISTPQISVVHGYNQEATFDLFSKPPPVGIYRVEVLVRNHLKRQVEFTLEAPKGS